MRTSDRITGLVTVILGVLLIHNSLGFPSLPKQQYGAGTFPVIIGTLLILFGGLLAIRGLLCSDDRLVKKWTGPIPARRFLVSVLAIVGAIIAYIELTPVLGFPLMAFLITGALVYGFYRQKLVLSAGIAAFSTVFIWIIFARLLHVPLDPGILEKVIY